MKRVDLKIYTYQDGDVEGVFDYASILQQAWLKSTTLGDVKDIDEAEQIFDLLAETGRERTELVEDHIADRLCEVAAALQFDPAHRAGYGVMRSFKQDFADLKAAPSEKR